MFYLDYGSIINTELYCILIEAELDYYCDKVKLLSDFSQNKEV